MGWNGLDLQTEFSELLGDTSTAFKARVLGWINDICRDIASKHSWPSLNFTGKKYIADTNEEQNLIIALPSAPTVAVATGGSLAASTSYVAAITFLQGESLTESRKAASAAISTTATDKIINLTNIPVSLDPLVTARKVYLSKAGGKYYYVGTISDNTATTYSITTDTTSTETPPDFDYIQRIEGNIHLDTIRQLDYRPYDQLKLLFGQSFSTGNPTFWASRGEGRCVMYPKASKGNIIAFSYYKVPNEIFASNSSEPELPLSLKVVLKKGVKWMGAEYRDRDDQFIQKQAYDAELDDAFSKFGRRAKVPLKVRDTQGNSDGYEVS